MDSTKENILMCENAVEIQELWRPYNLDIFVTKQSHMEPIYPRDYMWTTDRIKQIKEEYIWLPRQDQLQGMVKDLPRIKHFNGLLSEIYQFACNTTIAIKNNVNPDWSMEQLWLAFVMKEKYNKTWDGKQWIY